MCGGEKRLMIEVNEGWLTALAAANGMKDTAAVIGLRASAVPKNARIRAKAETETSRRSP
jgi:hypothetical protein